MQSTRPLSAIVLAAGQGTRMRSERPKPLHLLCGRPMVLYVLDALASIGPDRAIIVVGHSADRVTKKLSEHDGTFPIEFVEQVSQLGTGDAVSVALTAFDEDRDDDDDVLVLPGDSPLLTAATVERLVTTHRGSGAACTMLSAVVEDPTGYGRIVRGKGDRVVGIVEQADATPEQVALREVNTSMYCFRRGLLAPALRRVRPDNAQGELLPDRRDRGAARRRAIRSTPSRSTTRSRRRASTTGSSSRTPRPRCAPAPTSAGCAPG